MPEPRRIILEVSPELHALATGLAALDGRDLSAYVLASLLATLECDCEGQPVKRLPEHRPQP